MMKKETTVGIICLASIVCCFVATWHVKPTAKATIGTIVLHNQHK